MKKISSIIISILIMLSYLAVLNPISAATLDVGPGKTYENIQNAIDAASEGDVIEVYAGTYTEDLNISTNNIELRPVAGADVTIKGILFSDDGSIVPNININANNVRFHGFKVESPEVPEGNYSSGIALTGTSIEIYSNNFISLGTGECIAIQAYPNTVIPTGSISDLKIYDNSFEGDPDEGYIGVVIGYTDPNYGAGNVLIKDNTFEENILYAIISERYNTNILSNELTNSGIILDNTGILIQDLTSKEGSLRIQDGVVIQGNSIKGFDAAGIVVGKDSQILKNVVISDNIIQNNEIGIKTRSSASEIKINNNSILGNIKYEIENTHIDYLDAQYNWWGSNAGPMKSKIVGKVRYLPWIKNSELPVASISKIIKKNQEKKNNK
ncbi:MAG: hypothetical protein GYA51_13960 [Candidatus Methanofastidiosa archaeon]|nr:hypothetical protein [Candidatus Methanofastidiosa archaeon]